MRLMDVFLFGPAMLWIGARYNMKPWEKVFMYGGGIMTIYLNHKNYVANKELIEGEKNGSI